MPLCIGISLEEILISLRNSSDGVDIRVENTVKGFRRLISNSMDLHAGQRVSHNRSTGKWECSGNSKEVVGIVDKDFMGDSAKVIWFCEMIDDREKERVLVQHGYQEWEYCFRDYRCARLTAGNGKSISLKCEKSKHKLIRRCLREYVASFFHPFAAAA
jgi:hypothetical protein